MNIVQIALKEIKTALRDKGTFLFMIAFPIVLMLILGTALSAAFSGSLTVDDISLLYKNEATQPSLQQAWSGFSKALEAQGIKLVSLPAGEDGKAQIESDQNTAYAEMNDDGLSFYGGTKHSIETNILQGMLTAFADRYNLAASAARVDPSAAQAVLASVDQSADFIRESSLNPDKTPNSISYYAIAMSTMIGLYAALTGASLINSERKRNTAARLMATPVTRGEVFAGKVIGATLINFLCVLAVVVVSKLLFNADWGAHYGQVVLVLFTEVLFSISFGLGISYLIKGDASRTFIMIFTQIASFVGGAYFPVDDKHAIANLVTYISPLRWANVALTQVIYANELQAAWKAVSFNVGVAVIFLALAVIMMRRREAL